MSELKDGCPIFCMDSSAGGIVSVCARVRASVLKALVRCALKTYGPHCRAILPRVAHFCHILALACVSQWFVVRVALICLCTRARGCALCCHFVPPCK